ncbi:hypothetical protein LCGC14_0636040 [marine sediment metagenome]|uniref:Uncharacterized protein n=1 Tax=marine sediment metagenome TaxID=412755 RepID=A0A0F9TLZ7_9ZZZZ
MDQEDCKHIAGYYQDQHGTRRCSFCDKPIEDQTFDDFKRY